MSTARLLWIVVVLLAVPLIAQEGAPEIPSCDAEGYRQFDFWVGEWEVTTPDGERAGSNRIEKILNDCVLMESWEGAGGSVGKSFNMYYQRLDEWRQTWVDGAGGRLDLAGGLEDGRMVLRGEMPGRQGGMVLHEISWEPSDDGSVKQHWRTSTDGGESWSDAFVGIYRKR